MASEPASITKLDENIPQPIVEDAADHIESDTSWPDTSASPDVGVEDVADHIATIPTQNKQPIVVDATDHIAGRLSSCVAKLLLEGNQVSIVNCEKIMISGTRSNIIKEYREFLEIASVLNPKHGPFHPRRPDTIMKRMIRGMLPRKKPSGLSAHKRLRTYIGSPKELSSTKKIQFEKAKIRRAGANYTTMAQLGRTIGWTE